MMMMTTAADELTCWIYRASRQEEMYLYLREKDNFALVPDSLRNALGRLELVLELTLSPDRHLAREDVRQVLANLHGQGFHLQMPPKVTTRLYEGE